MPESLMFLTCSVSELLLELFSRTLVEIPAFTQEGTINLPIENPFNVVNNYSYITFNAKRIV